MNLELLAGPLAQAIGWALLHALWQGAAIAALLAVLLAAFARRGPNLRYALSCGALGLIVVLAVATAIRSYPGASASATVTTLARVAPDAEPPGVAVSTSASAPTTTWNERLRGAARAANRNLPLIVTVWLVGVALFTLRLAWSWWRTRRLANLGVTRASDRWQSVVRRLSAALGVRQMVRLLESAAVDVPSVIGVVRPAILLPASTLVGLTPAQIEMILAHELAHIRRQDFLVNLLQALVETLLFYHPAVWWISERIRVERENCCDDLAIAVCGNRIQYARALTRLEELRAPALSMAAVGNGGSLLDRVRRIVRAPGAASSPAMRGVTALTALTVVLLALAVPSLPAIGAWRSESEALQQAEARAAALASRVVIQAARLATTAVAVLPRTFEGAPPAAPAPDPGPAALADDAAPAPPAMPAVFAPAAGDARGEDVEVDVDADVDPEVFQSPDGKPSIDELIAMRVHDVTPRRIREMRSLFPRLRLQEIAGMNAVGATPEFVREMRDVGLRVARAGDAQGLASLGVTAKWVEAMRETGIPIVTAQDAQSLKALGVTPEYVRDMREAGLDVGTAEEATSLKALGVTARFIADARSMGLGVDTAKEIQGLKALGVTSEFVEALREVGLVIRSAQEAQGLKAVGVTPDYVRGMRDAGIDVDTPDEAQGLRALGVSPEFVREMRDAGVRIAKASEAQSLRALNITPSFVRKLAKAGYRDLSVDELARLGASGITGDFIREMSKYRSQ